MARRFAMTRSASAWSKAAGASAAAPAHRWTARCRWTASACRAAASSAFAPAWPGRRGHTRHNCASIPRPCRRSGPTPSRRRARLAASPACPQRRAQHRHRQAPPNQPAAARSPSISKAVSSTQAVNAPRDGAARCTSWSRKARLRRAARGYSHTSCAARSSGAAGRCAPASSRRRRRCSARRCAGAASPGKPPIRAAPARSSTCKR